MRTTPNQLEYIELVKEYADKTKKIWCVVKTAFWKYQTLIDEKHYAEYIVYDKWLIQLNWQEEILWHVFCLSALLRCIEDSIREENFICHCFPKRLVTTSDWCFLSDIPNSPPITWSDEQFWEVVNILKQLKK
jgi:hypothetical protein